MPRRRKNAPAKELIFSVALARERARLKRALTAAETDKVVRNLRKRNKRSTTGVKDGKGK
jgi:hypothetical protein